MFNIHDEKRDAFMLNKSFGIHLQRLTSKPVKRNRFLLNFL